MTEGALHIDPILLDHKIYLLENKLIEKFDEQKGCWSGRQWMNAGVSAEFLILCKYTGLYDMVRIKGVLKELEINQNEDGGFSAYANGPSDNTVSANCHLALDLFSEYSNKDTLSKSRAHHRENGKLKNVLLIVKFYYSLFDRYPIRKIPKLRPELLLVPRWTRLTFWDMASWARSWFVPLNIIWHYEINKKKTKRIKFTPKSTQKAKFWELRKKGLIKAHNWLMNRQEKDGSWYAVFHSTMISVMALYKMGYEPDSPSIQKALSFIYSLQDNTQNTCRQMPFLGPVWDTGLALQALNSYDNKTDQEIQKKAISFLLDRQSNEISDWRYKNNHGPGGWGFEFINRQHPDCDSTAIVLRVLKQAQIEDQQIDKGLNWLLSMQNSDGSWAAFNRNCNNIIIENYLRLIRVNIGYGSGLIIDPGTPDLTAHVLQTLVSFGYNKSDKKVQKAIKWLIKKQNKDGSWFGRWGLSYLYGSSSVLKALHDIGEDDKAPYVQKGIKFLTTCQNEDGGFGELPEAYFRKKQRGKGPSTATQTAWVLNALILSGICDEGVINKGIAFLLDKINLEGEIDDPFFHAVAAPPLYQRYELYPLYFTLLTLKAFKYKVH